MKTALLKTHTDQLNGYQGPVFIPVMDDCDSVPYGEVMADIKKKRNVGNHRRYFSFVKQAFDMQEFYSEPDIFRKVLQLKAGFFDLVVTEKGVNAYLPKSISWDELDEIEFKDLFNRVVNAFIRDFGDRLNDIQINTILEY